MKICFYSTREFDELDYIKECSREFGIDYVYTSEYPSPENVKLAEGCEAVSMTPCDFNGEMVEAFHRIGVKYLTARSIGYDHIDLAKAKELGMRVANVSYTANGVANYAIMLMLMCLRRFGHIVKRQEVQDYSLKGKLGRDISSCTVGIIGCGHIGTTVMRHLSGFGCRLLGYDLYQNDEVPKYGSYVPLEELLAQSDVISLHMNASDENEHLINAERIAAMKDGAILINTARGRLIDTDALIEGLENGKLGGAGLDVLEHEDGLYYYNRMGDVIVNHDMAILRSFPNVILSPHTAFYTGEDVSDMVKSNFESFAAFAKSSENAPHEILL